jgi:hypothetical protein
MFFTSQRKRKNVGGTGRWAAGETGGRMGRWDAGEIGGTWPPAKMGDGTMRLASDGICRRRRVLDEGHYRFGFFSYIVGSLGGFGKKAKAMREVGRAST